MKRSRLIPISALLAVGAAAGCSDGPQVTIANNSEHTLKNVTMTGSGFSESIAEIAPRSTDSITVHPSGESSLRVTFDVDGRRIESADCCYFENNPLYTVAVTVDGDLKVTAVSNLGKY